ncbi:hypothetical protein FA13DRAFT_1738995 [Coprinellus micaceus]|uniref:F-box domain-containing protein n=1 Tax=Coprinellus micaceus TaxID=71717 RepID=A0A4Y7SRY6_COPMI|nr:hypothetical protein FA13DRAFT_1738995 [Coprinellus micaceus]
MSLDSPFTRYLDTNYIPHPDEVQIIKGLINDHETALHYLLRGKSSRRDGTRSFFHMASVANGGEAIRSHQDFIRLHSALISPARAVPLDESRRSTALKKETPRHPIVTITHVCHEWRELAVGIPSLWRHIHIDLSPRPSYNGYHIGSMWPINSSHRSMDLTTERVTIFLSRAAPLPIVLSCAGADAHSLEDLNFHREVTPLINILRTAQWEDVSLSIDIKTSTSPLVHLLPIPATSVATIRSVKARELKGVWGLQHVFPAGSPPLQNLQVLDLDCSGEQLLNTGPHCERLTHLSIGPARKNSGDVHSASLLVAHEALNILQGFPNLQECELRFSATYNYLSWPDLHSHASDKAEALIIQEYGSQLTEVTLGYGHLTQSALTSCLEHLKNVTSLTLSPAQTGPRPQCSAFDTRTPLESRVVVL